MALARVRCPNCRKDVAWEEANPWRPFCSERCRLADLGGWATERYRIPGEEVAPQDDADDGEESKSS